MTTPAPTPSSRPPWFPYVVGVGGAIAFAVVLFLIVVNLGGEGPRAAGTSTTTVVATTSPATAATTDVTTATTEGTTTTTAAAPTTTTTEVGPLIEDRFEGSSLASPLFPPEVNTFDIVNETGRLTAHSPGTLPVMYGAGVGETQITFRIRVNEGSDAGRYGAFLLAEDPSDGVLEHWVGVYLDPRHSQLVIVTFMDGVFGPSWLAETTGTAAFGFGEWIDVAVSYSDGTVMVEINGELAMSTAIDFAVDHGFVGFGMYAGAPDDRMRVDDFVVEEVG
jgi:hypothetical protein